MYNKQILGYSVLVKDLVKNFILLIKNEIKNDKFVFCVYTYLLISYIHTKIHTERITASIIIKKYVYFQLLWIGTEK